jgi:hypothetical protein
MIPNKYTITLTMSPTKWHWSVEDDEWDTVARGSDSDFSVAAVCALAAHDKLIRKEQEDTLGT